MKYRPEQSVWIIRHGERIDFVNPTWGETAENPREPHLSDNGRLQAIDTGKRLRGSGIRHIFASPFRRTLETASLISEILDVPVSVEPGACELLLAKWFPENPLTRSVAELSVEFPRIDPSHEPALIPSHPETWDELYVRSQQAIHALLDRYHDTFLVVGHGATVLGCTQGLIGSKPEVSGHCCGVVKLSNDGHAWTMDLAGDTSHLRYCDGQTRLI